ncbi:hypothetical protein EGW08_020365 [Elysia chlorotica]|uniref:Uncharacterized protein n=1 Tax=Elysia chlorotica TaxID=188477 RepID=A0A433SRL4_ELYCH|nr:hypothetical protein EGW08_020365 [Elysia chlorotica]
MFHSLYQIKNFHLQGRRNLNTFANGLTVPEHTVAETIELSESPQDGEGQVDLPRAPSGNGSAVAVTGAPDSTTQTGKPGAERATELISPVLNSFVTGMDLEQETPDRNSCSDTTARDTLIESFSNTFPAENSADSRVGVWVGPEGEDSTKTPISTTLDGSASRVSSATNQLDADSTDAACPADRFVKPASDSISKYTSSIDNLQENVDVTKNIDKDSLVDNTSKRNFTNNLRPTENLRSSRADNPGKRGNSRNKNIKGAFGSPDVSKASPINSYRNTNSNSLQQTFSCVPDPPQAFGAGGVYLGFSATVPSHGPASRLDKATGGVGSTPLHKDTSPDPGCRDKLSAGSATVRAVKSCPPVFTSDSESESNEEPGSPLKTANPSTRPAAPMLVRVSECGLDAQNGFSQEEDDPSPESVHK